MNIENGSIDLSKVVQGEDKLVDKLNPVVSKMDEFMSKFDEAEKKSKKKIKFTIDISGAKPEKIDDINSSLDRLNSKITQPKNKMKYFQSFESAANDVKKAWNNLVKEFNNGNITQENIYDDKNATAVLRYANAFEALGGNIKDISPEINELVLNMRSLDKYTTKKGYSFTVDGFKEAFSEFDILKKSGVLFPNFEKEIDNPVASLLSLKQEIVNTANISNNSFSEMSSGISESAEKIKEDILSILDMKEKLDKTIRDKNIIDYDYEISGINIYEYEDIISDIERYYKMLDDLKIGRDDALDQATYWQNRNAEKYNETGMFDDDYSKWMDSYIESYYKYSDEIEYIQNQLNSAIKNYTPSSNEVGGIDKETVIVLISLLQSLNSEIIKIRESFGSIDDESGLTTLLSQIKEVNTFLSSTSQEIKNLTTVISNKDLNLSINTGGGNKIAQTSKYTREALKHTEKAYLSLVKDMESEYGNLGNIFSGNTRHLFMDYQRYAEEVDPDNMTKSLFAYKELIDVLKEAASLKGFDLSDWGGKFEAEAIQANEALDKVISGETAAVDAAKKLSSVFGGGNINIDGEGVLKQLQEIVDQLLKIHDLLDKGLSFNDALKGLKQNNIDGEANEFLTLEEVIKNITNAIQLKNEAFLLEKRIVADASKAEVESLEELSNILDAIILSVKQLNELFGDMNSTSKGGIENISKLFSDDDLNKIKSLLQDLQDIKPLSEFLNSLSSTSIDQNLPATLSELAKSIGLLKDSFNNFPSIGSSIFSDLKDLAQQKDTLKDLAEVLKASSEKINEVKKKTDSSKKKQSSKDSSAEIKISDKTIDNYFSDLNKLKRAEKSALKGNVQDRAVADSLTQSLIEQKNLIENHLDDVSDIYKNKYREIGEAALVELAKVNPENALINDDIRDKVAKSSGRISNPDMALDAAIAERNAQIANSYDLVTSKLEKYNELKVKSETIGLNKTETVLFEKLSLEVDEAKSSIENANDAAEKFNTTLNGSGWSNYKQDMDNVADAQKRFAEELERTEKKARSDYYTKTVSDLNGELSKISKIDDSTPKAYKIQLEKIEEIIKKIRSISDNGLIDQSNFDQFKNLNAEANKLIRTLKSSKEFKPANTSAAQSLEKSMVDWLKKNKAAAKVYGGEIENLLAILHKVGASAEEVDRVRYAFNAIDIAADNAGLKGQTFVDRIKNKFKELGAYLLSFASFYDIINIGRQAITIVRELDDALTEMRKVSSEPLSALKEYQNISFDISGNVGTTSAQLQQSTADWMRLGESLSDAKQSAAETAILKNISEFENIDDATDSLVAMSQAYTDLDKIDIIDKLNNIGNNFSISTDGLATGLQKSASALKVAGNNMDEAIALVTSGNAIVQDPDSVGAGVRTIALRIQGTEEAKQELASLGEDVEDYVVQTSSKLNEQVINFTKAAGNNFKGVSLLDENGNYRSTYEILQDIADVYDEIIATDKEAGTNRMQGLLELLAGKNRSNIAASILQNGDMLRDVYESSQDSSGSAQRELDSYLDSVSGKISKLQNQLQELAFVSFNSDDLKVIIDLATGLLSLVTDLVDNFGLLNIAIGAVGGYFATKSGFGIVNQNASGGYDFFNLFKELTKEVPKVSKEVDNLFSKFHKNDSFSRIWGSIDKDNFADTNFIKWAEGLESVERSTMNAAEALKKYRETLVSTKTNAPAVELQVDKTATAAQGIEAGQLITANAQDIASTDAIELKNNDAASATEGSKGGKQIAQSAQNAVDANQVELKGSDAAAAAEGMEDGFIYKENAQKVIDANNVDISGSWNTKKDHTYSGSKKKDRKSRRLNKKGGMVSDLIEDASELQKPIELEMTAPAPDFSDVMDAADDAAKISGSIFSTGFLSKIKNLGVKVGTVFSKLKTGIVSIGKLFASFGANMIASFAVSFAISKAIEWWDKFIHKTEIAIEKGLEAKETVSGIFDEFSKKKTSILDFGISISGKEDIESVDNALEAVAEKYSELSSGVNDHTNQNISLSNEEYQEYLDICNQLEDQFPSLVSGHDDQGNAILRLSENASSATKELLNLYDASMLTANVEIGKNLQSIADGVIAQVGVYEDVITKLENENSKNDNKIESLNTLGSQVLTKDSRHIVTKDGITNEVIKILKDNGIYTYEPSFDSNGLATIGFDGLSEVSDEILAEINKSIEALFVSQIDEHSKQNNANDINVLSNKLMIQDQWKSLYASMGEYLQTADSFAGLDVGLQNAIVSALEDVDIDVLTGTYEGQVLPFIYGEFIAPISNLTEEAQKEIVKFFELDTSKMNLSEYEEVYLDLLNSLSADASEQSRLAEMLGIQQDYTEYTQKIDDLRSRFGNIQEISELSIEDINVLSGILSAEDYNGKTWDDAIKALEGYKNQITETEQIEFSSLFSKDSAVSEKVDNFQTNISSIQSALEGLKSGEFSSGDMLDLIQEFPQLATETENLEFALNGLAIDNFVSTMDLIQQKMGETTDPTQIAALKSFSDELKRAMMEAMDISSLTPENVKSQMLSSGNSTLMSGQQFLSFRENLDKLITEFGGTKTGLGAIMSLAAAIELDPSLAYTSYEEWKSYVESDEVLVKIKAHEESLAKIENDLEDIQNRRSILGAKQSKKEASGKSLTASDYSNQNVLNRREIKSKEEQIAEWTAELELEIPEEKRRELEGYISQAETEIQELEADIIKNNIEREKIPLTNLQNELSSIETEISNKEAEIERNRKNGIKATESDYLILAELEKQRQDNLIEQGNWYQEHLNNSDLDVNDSLYIEWTNGYNSVTEAAKDAEQAQADWNKERQNLPVLDLQTDLETLEAEATAIENNIALKEAKNVKVSKSDYRALIRNGDKQISNLIDQNKELEIQRDELKELGGDWESVQSQIDANNSSINSIRISQQEWLDTIDNLVVANAQSLSSAISSAYDEMNSLTGLSSDTMNTLLTQFSDLSGIDTSTLFYRSTKGIKVNTSALEEFSRQEDKIIQNRFKQEIEAQRRAIESYQEQIGRGNTDDALRSMQSNLESLLNQQSSYFAEYQKQMETFSKYNAIGIAEGTANQGAKYDNLQSKLESWKEMYDKGLIGTDDFKSLSEYFNVDGLGFAENFEQDYRLAKRYLTEDATGIFNFYDDLVDKGLASFDEMSQSYTLLFDDVNKAAQTMDMGDEWFLDMLGKAEEYGAINTIVTSVTDAALQTEELNQKLFEAQKKLIDLKNAGASDEAIAQQEAEIERIKSQASDLVEVEGNYLDGLNQKYIDGFDNLKNTIDEYEQYRKEALERGDYKSAVQWEQLAQNLADEYDVGLEITGTGLRVDESDYQSLYNKIYEGKGSWEKPAIISGFRGHDHDVYGETYKKVIKAHNDENSLLEEKTKILSNYTLEQLKSIDLNDQSYDGTFEGAKEAEQALDAIATELGLSVEEAQMLAYVMEAFGQTKFESSFIMETESVQNGLAELQHLQSSGEITSEIDFSADTANMSLDELEERLKELEELSELELEFSGDAKAALDSLMADTDTQIKIKTKLENDTNLESWLTMSDEELSKEIGVELNQEQAAALRQQVEDLLGTESVPLTVKIEESQLSQLTATTANLDTSEAEGKLSTYKENLNDLPSEAPEGGTKVKVDTSDANVKITAVNTRLNTLNTVKTEPKIKANISDFLMKISTVLNKLASINDKTVTVTTVEKKVAEVNGTFAHGTLRAARANGTAYNMLNLRPAYAKGTDVSLKSDETALVNELGTEGLIRNGVLYEIPGGMHYQALKKGDIILSVKQMEQLRSTGKASGNGKAYAEGTVKNSIPLMNAYAKPAAGKSSFTKPVSLQTSSTSKSTNNLQQAVNNLGNTVDKTTKKANKLDKALKDLEKLYDWIEVNIDRLQKDIDYSDAQSENAIGYAAKNAKLSDSSKTTRSLIDVNDKGAAEYKAQALRSKKKVGLSDALYKKILDGTIEIQELDEKQKKQVDAVKPWIDKMYECIQSSEELKTSLKDIEKTKFDNVVDEFDNLLSHIEHTANMISAYMDNNEAAGYVNSTKYYDALLKNNKKEQDKLKEEQVALVKQLQASMDSGIIKKGDTRWHEMQNEINAVTQALVEAEGEAIEFQWAIEEIKWDKFADGRDAVQALIDEQDFMIDLMADEKQFEDSGKITDIGMATMGLHGSNYNTYLKESEAYAKEIMRLEAMIDSTEGEENKKLKAQKQEMVKARQDATLAAKDEEQAIKSLVQDGIDLELDSMQKLIDKYKEARDSKKNLYDYQNDISDKTDEVSKYQKQVNAFKNDTSEEGRIRLLNAQKNLEEAQKNLEKTEYEKFIEDSDALLDELYTEYETVLNARLDNIDELMLNVITTSNENSAKISEVLSAEAAAVGYSFENGLDLVWGENGTATAVLSTFSGKFDETSTTVTTTLGKILEGVDKLYEKSIENAKEDLGKVNDTGTGGANPQVNAPTPGSVGAGGSGGGNAGTGNNDNKSEGEKLGPVSGIKATLKKGIKKSADVKELQKALNALKYRDANGKKLLIDGWFGPKTQAALKKFQKAMKVKVSGKLDDATKKAFKKKGYASGTNWIKEDEWAWTQEKGTEIITRSDGSILTPLKKGSGVINNPKTEQILDLANNHNEIMKMVAMSNKLADMRQAMEAADMERRILESQMASMNNFNSSGNSNGNITIENVFHLEGMKEPEEFMNWMTTNSKAQQVLKDVVLAEALGKSSVYATRKRF